MYGGRAAGNRSGQSGQLFQTTKRHASLSSARRPFVSPDEYHQFSLADNWRTAGEVAAEVIVIRTPTDADYWLLSDAEVSITDMLKTAPEVQWDGINKINPEYFITGPVGTAVPQTPSSGVIEVQSSTNSTNTARR